MFKKFKNMSLFVSMLLSLFIINSPAYSLPDNTDKHQQNIKVLERALNAAKIGPTTVTLIDQATINIPEDYLYVPTKEASDFMHAIGNRTDQNFLGLIFSRNDELRWFITVDFIKSGYISDNDTKSWDSDAFFKSLERGTEEDNKERVRNGVSPLHVIGWIERPFYNSTTHKLVWSILAKEDGASESTVNYNTYALGRDGYFKFNLITPESAISQDKIHAKKMLTALHFNNGKLYEDFVEGKDKIAEYGVAALITGIVAKKLGLLALAGALFIKIWKLLVFIFLMLGSKIKRLFRRNKKSVIE